MTPSRYAVAVETTTLLRTAETATMSSSFRTLMAMIGSCGKGGNGNDTQRIRGDDGNDCIIQKDLAGNDNLRTEAKEGDDLIMIDAGEGAYTITYDVSSGRNWVLIDGGTGEDTLTINAGLPLAVYDEKGKILYKYGEGGSEIIVKNIEDIKYVI